MLLHPALQSHPAMVLYPALYLGAGMLTLLVMGGGQLWRRRHQEPDSAWLISLMHELHPERKKLRYRIWVHVIGPVLAAVAIVLFWPVVWLWPFAQVWDNRRKARLLEEEIFEVKAPHRLERLSVDQIEAREGVEDPLNAAPRLPFGHLNAPWSKLKSAMQSGDVFWSFAAPWTDECGQPQMRKGYVLWRRRKAVGHVLTMCKALEADQPSVATPTQSDGPRSKHIEMPLDKFEVPAFLRKQAD